MKEPTFDADGYPTDETLGAIEAWPYRDAAGVLDFVAAAWHWPEFGVRRKLKAAEAKVVDADKGDRFLRLATGGWSGNESLIAALDRNHMVTALCWQMTARGGLHIYRYSDT